MDQNCQKKYLKQLALSIDNFWQGYEENSLEILLAAELILESSIGKKASQQIYKDLAEWLKKWRKIILAYNRESSISLQNSSLNHINNNPLYEECSLNHINDIPLYEESHKNQSVLLESDQDISILPEKSIIIENSKLEDELEEELIEQMEIESEQQIFSIQDIPSSSSSNEIDHDYMSAGKKKNILENRKISLGINKLKNQRSNVKKILKNVLFAKK